MELAFKIVVFEPRKDVAWTTFLRKIHSREQALLDDVVPTEYVSGETLEGEPIFTKALDELGPETAEHVAYLTEKHRAAFPGLAQAFEECQGRLSFRLPSETINWFGDAASIDMYFVDRAAPRDYSARGIILLCNDEYFGHVWYFTSSEFPRFCAIYGMKASLVNVLVRSSCDSVAYRKGIAKRILGEGVFALARQEGCQKLLVPWPLPPMIPILQDLGFAEHNVFSPNPERQFLRPYTVTSNYYSLELT